MDPTAFKLHRVVVGVVVGLVLLLLGFYGWVQFRTSQYHDRADAVVARYHHAYALCVAAGSAQEVCTTRAVDACTTDPFWAVGKPFSFDLGSTVSDASLRCHRGVPG
jgi:hypothetical protein